MAAKGTQIVLDSPAAEFRLPATNGKSYSMDDVAGERGTVVVFICNHCPYVKAVIDRMVADARVLISEGVGFAAICSNDAASYPEDSFENMKHFAKAHDFPFPYLHDETQTVARAYGAVCTPDFFGYNADRKLKYRGRLDEGRTTRPARGRPESLSRPCVRLRRLVWRRLTKSRLSVARSNGRTNKAESLSRGYHADVGSLLKRRLLALPNSPMRFLTRENLKAGLAATFGAEMAELCCGGWPQSGDRGRKFSE
jgi:peroxiredoxin